MVDIPGNHHPPDADSSDAGRESSDQSGGHDENVSSKKWHTKDDKSTPKRGGAIREVVIIVASVLLLVWLLQTFVGRQYVIPSESMEPTLHGCSGCTNDRIVIDKLSYEFGGKPKPGDVVVFKAPTASWNENWSSPRSSNPVIRGAEDVLSWFGFAPPDENDLVKRVIAVGGQTVQCRNSDGKGVTVNGKPLREPYIDMTLQRQDPGAYSSGLTGQDGRISSCLGSDFGPITVPANHVWVMGDNRGNSMDSRYHMDDQYQGTVPDSDIRGKVRLIIYPFSRWGTVKSINPQS